MHRTFWLSFVVGFASLLGIAGCGSSDADYGQPGDSTLPEAKPFDGAPAGQPLPDRKAP